MNLRTQACHSDPATGKGSARLTGSVADPVRRSSIAFCSPKLRRRAVRLYGFGDRTVPLCRMSEVSVTTDSED
jgi:hypothetical protein